MFHSALERVIHDVVTPSALAVDREGRFPSEAVTALGAAGILGLTVATEHGGVGKGLAEAAQVVERLARACGSTAMVACMHYSGVAVLNATAPASVLREVAAGRHLSTLAFSEQGSRSHFWAPLSSARNDGGNVILDAEKSWITSASHATAYVWSSRPLGGEGASTLWLVPRDAPGLSVRGPFDGLGLRGNDASPVRAQGVCVPGSARLGDDGKGFDLMMGVVLPTFNVLNAAASVGHCEAAVSATATHATATRHEEAGTSLADLPTIRANIARMRSRTDMAATLLGDTLAAMAVGRPDTMLRVLEVKAVASEAAIDVTMLAMRTCGGAAYRKEGGVERHFRDAQAASVMGPTTDVLYDFIGKATCGLPLF